MRIFFAGALEVIGRHLLPLLIDAGHTVGAMTRSTDKAGLLVSAGAQAIVCDVFDDRASQALFARSRLTWFCMS
jgi:nucleoside-diphosphate-sugar epimerase